MASSITSGLQWPELAFAAFAVGVVYTFAIGAVVIGGLVTGPDLPLPARPALTILIIPPATGGLAWLAAHRGAVAAVGYGFAGLLAFTTLIVVCLLPYLRQPSFHMGFWIFALPIAAGSNFAIRWFHGADAPAWRPLTWVVRGAATLSFVALGTATLFHAFRRSRRQGPLSPLRSRPCARRRGSSRRPGSPWWPGPG
ncbi:hypothetical protein AB0D13_35130 [Streptomyces sp. NPDC048430]|uniref:SLAC1 family transporter n=1 Tax=Streptomyces sp. NPDC048430 TaxID=3155388 RepID=UPI0034474F95